MEEGVLRHLGRGDPQSDEVVFVAEVWLLQAIARLANVVLVSLPNVVPVLDRAWSERLVEICLDLQWRLLLLFLYEPMAKLELALGLRLHLTRHRMSHDDV